MSKANGIDSMRDEYDDLIGPPLARMIAHPLLADVAYLALKPAEWIARFALRCIVPEIDELAGSVYR